MKLTYFSLHGYKSRIFRSLRKERVILVLACCTTVLIIVTPNMGLNSHENEIAIKLRKNKAVIEKEGV